MDLDRLELLSAADAGHVATRLGADVAGIAAADPHSARVSGIVTLQTTDTQDAGQPLEPAWT